MLVLSFEHAAPSIPVLKNIFLLLFLSHIPRVPGHNAPTRAEQLLRCGAKKPVLKACDQPEDFESPHCRNIESSSYVVFRAMLMFSNVCVFVTNTSIDVDISCILPIRVFDFLRSLTVQKLLVKLLEVTLWTFYSSAPTHGLPLKCSRFPYPESDLLQFSRALSLSLSDLLHVLLCYLYKHLSFLPGCKLT